MSSETQPLIGNISQLQYAKSKRSKTTLLIALSLITLGLLISSLNHTTSKGPGSGDQPPAHIPGVGGPTLTPNRNETIIAKHGAVASDQQVCSDLGVSILKKGGYAADAAVTTCLCIGVTTMYSAGIGGGGFITTKKFDEDFALSIDAREMAPGKAHKDMYKGKEFLSQKGGLAAGIPGELKGLYTLFERHGSGKLTWEELVMPVAELAKNGFKLNRLMELAIQRESINFDKQDWKFVFNDDGSLMKAGQTLTRPAFANTLTEIAKNGSDAIFYDPNGRIAQSLSKKAIQHGGILTAEDFGKYNVNVEEAITVNEFTSRNLTVFTANGASSGLALASGLKIMNSFEDFGDNTDAELKVEDLNPVESQRLIETMKWMGSIRSHLGDLGIYNDNVTAIKEHNRRYQQFLKDDYVDSVLSKIDDDHTLPSWEDYNPAYQPNEPHGTSSLSVVDDHGNAVSITTTVNLLFGSAVHDPETGVILNDEMDDFSLPTTKNAFKLEPSVFNYIEPYKRPLSSSAQTIIVDPSTNKIEMAIGAAGGSRIATAVLQAIIRSFHYDLTLAETIAFPRIHHQLLPNIVYIETPKIESLNEALVFRGHDVENTVPMTAMNAIRIVNGTIHAQSDHWRKLGVASGY